MKLKLLSKAALFTVASAVAVGAFAQSAEDAAAPNLNIPRNPEFLGTVDPTVRKATAIVNGDVITGTDVEQRLALTLLANGGKVSPEEVQLLRQQVLRNLVDETLQIQAATAEEIEVKKEEIDAYYQRYAENLGQSPEQFNEYLRGQGSSDKTVKRQIQGELAWRRLQGREIEPFINVADEEVRAVMERLNAAKGTKEFRVGEIFLSATPETAPQTRANAERILQQLQQGASFVAYARQFSEASTAAVGGDLGWVRAEQLPGPLAEAVNALPVGSVSQPIQVPGGFSIIAVQDTRQVLMPDPRDAVLSLKQLSITFPPGSTQQQAEARINDLAGLGQSMGGCGGADAAAARIGAEVVTSDQTRVRDLPGPLQEMLLQMSIGQSTRPFGSFEDGVRILVLCGRDDPQDTAAPSFDAIHAQISEERINMRSRRYLRDLRRDAVVEYR